MPSADISSETATYCYIDFDFDNYRQKFATAAAFVSATDSRYGFSSKDIRQFGGSEIKRIPDLIASDHEWASKVDGGIEIRPPTAGNRIVFKLFWDVAPLACENFATLCSNGSLLPTDTKKKTAKPAPIGESGKPLTYRNSVVHRIIPKFIMQGGDFVFGNGSGGESIYNGKKFKDERAGLLKKHSKRGMLSMGNSGKNSNTSQWFITFDKAPQCDGKHVVFGEIISGWEVLDEAEKYGSSDGNPTLPVTVTDCGVWGPLVSAGCGYWYDQPDDESYSGTSPVFMVRPRVALITPNPSVQDKFTKCLQGQCSITSIILDKDGSSNSSTSTVLARILELLTNFAVDVVLVAPACKAVIERITLPTSWTNTRSSTTVSKEEVIMESKPIDALRTIHIKSWLANATQPAFHLDGTVI